MRISSLKSINFTEEELKAAAIQYLHKIGENELAKHLKNNVCTMNWEQDTNEFSINIDGMFYDTWIVP